MGLIVLSFCFNPKDDFIKWLNNSRLYDFKLNFHPVLIKFCFRRADYIELFFKFNRTSFMDSMFLLRFICHRIKRCCSNTTYHDLDSVAMTLSALALLLWPPLRPHFKAIHEKTKRKLNLIRYTVFRLMSSCGYNALILAQIIKLKGKIPRNCSQSIKMVCHQPKETYQLLLQDK